jgi:hypothetical protein
MSCRASFHRDNRWGTPAEKAQYFAPPQPAAGDHSACPIYRMNLKNTFA